MFTDEELDKWKMFQELALGDIRDTVGYALEAQDIVDESFAKK